jgi:hypothetical protein
MLLAICALRLAPRTEVRGLDAFLW